MHIDIKIYGKLHIHLSSRFSGYLQFYPFLDWMKLDSYHGTEFSQSNLT